MCGSPSSQFKRSQKTGRAKCSTCGEIMEPDDDFAGGSAMEAPRSSRRSGGGRATDRAKNPGIALLVVGGLSALISLGYSGLTIVGAMQGPPPERPGMPAAEAAGQKFGFYAAAFGIPIGTFVLTGTILMGGYQMLNAQSWTWSLMGALAAMVPCCNFTFLIGFPIGIWALVVLFDPQVKTAFR
ncbi:hypothetical protein LzC2_15450 [Planctomycetes bacterium LzC2]|uniref:DUF4190 domain-containing protein n=2 Tax=Alienimonas chondri TaxID=2681879 RepID=A0ABX1VD86_9PLAN|nr:hypothetical protein [Alienimonas chondri]